ncbi:hypothetical protein MKY34_19510 [Sporosarcina sp. FSL K6-1522]|uniref:hypothetical protein n=1 Tax=Sporosarcina sp. FSL K6-1522 TaxID=2921554 RepID=UPI00315AA876
MKSKWSLLYVGIASVLLLSACGTDTGSDKPDNNANSSEEVAGTENPDIQEDTEDAIVEEDADVDTDADVESDTTVDTDTEVDKPEDKEDAVTKDDENTAPKDDLTQSDEQDYAIAILPNYTLTSEEPGKDSLYVNNDESIFMRIETVAKENASYDSLVEDTKNMLEAISDGNTPSELTDTASLPAGEGIDNVTALTVKTPAGSFTGMVFERDGLLIKLTIFDSAQEEHFQNFLKMGETIVKK